MADPLTPQISDRICKHMNEDHADAILLYAKVYGKAATATSAEMLSIDAAGMNLAAQIEGQSQNLRIPFDHPLQDSEDAHQTLIGMVRSARQQAS